MLVKIRSS